MEGGEMKLGQVIKSYRLHKEISLKQISIEIGVSGATMSRVENSNFKPDLVTFKKILDWLIEESK